MGRIFPSDPHPDSTGFVRGEGHSMALGTVVAYRLAGFSFTILAGRDGIMVEGKFPWVGPDGIKQLKSTLDHAVIHHQHLASFEIGTKQTPLTEEQVMEVLTAATAMADATKERVM
jgi:hypothetical protein